MYGYHLALMPAEGSDILDLLVQEGTGIAEGVTSSSALQSSYVLNLRKLLKVHTVGAPFPAPSPSAHTHMHTQSSSGNGGGRGSGSQLR